MQNFPLTIAGSGEISTIRGTEQEIPPGRGADTSDLNDQLFRVGLVSTMTLISAKLLRQPPSIDFSNRISKILDCIRLPFLVDTPPDGDPLLLAIETGDISKTGQLIEGANVNARDEGGEPLLLKAVKAEKAEVVNLLIQHGADEESITLALRQSAGAGNLEIVQLIVKWKNDRGDNGWKKIYGNYSRNLNNPLLASVLAQKVPVAEFLLSQGAEVNAPLPTPHDSEREIWDKPLLYRAVERGNYDLVNCLIAYGADVNEPCRWLYHAILGVSTLDSDNRFTPLEEAVNRNRFDIAQLLIDNGAEISGPAGKRLKQNQLETIQLLMSQWKSLYALGITKDELIKILPQKPPTPKEEKQLTVVIENKAAKYPLSFLTQIPYFNALINGPWSQISKESNRLQLNEAPFFQDQNGDHFICNHEVLRALQKKLSNPNALWEEDFRAFSSLGVGIPSFLDYPRQLSAVKTILKMEAELLKNPGAQFGGLTRILSPESPFEEEEMRAILEPQEPLPIEWTIDYRPHDVGGAIDQTVRELNRFIEKTSGWNRTFYCNRLIFDFVQFLEAKDLAILSKEKSQPANHPFSPKKRELNFIDRLPSAFKKKIGSLRQGPSLERKGPNYIVEELLIVLEKCPKLSEFLTILELPPSATFQEPGFADVLRSLPNLLYLRITIGKGERIKIEDSRLHEEGYAIQLRSETPHYDLLIKEKALDKDIASQHGALRLLEILGQEFTPGQKETLESLFPHADLLDIKTAELEDLYDRQKRAYFMM